MSSFLSSRLGWLVAVAVVLVAWLSPLGDLTPPPGPVTSTMKPLSQVEPRTAITVLPFIINQPGGYYLAGNLTGSAGQSGITVNSSAVVIDLMGFRLTGAPGSVHGINVAVQAQDLQVRNGAVFGWGQDGIHANSITNGRLTELMLSVNGQSGASGGDNWQVAGCVAQDNGGDGLRFADNALVRDVTTVQNGGDGLKLASGQVSDVIARENGVHGINGTGTGLLITRCTALTNGSAGIVAQNSALVTDCNVRGNFVEGIRINTESLVRGCNSSHNTTYGVRTTGKNNVVDGLHSVADVTAFWQGADPCVFVRSFLQDGIQNGVGFGVFGPIVFPVGQINEPSSTVNVYY